MPNEYSVIVPSLDHEGPVIFATDLARAAKAKGYKVNIFYLSGQGSGRDTDFADQVSKFKLPHIWRLQGIVHTHCLRPDLLGGVIGLRNNVTVITTLHNMFKIDLGYDHSRMVVALFWYLWRISLLSFDHVVCITKSMKNYYTGNIPLNKLEVIHNCRSKTVSRGELEEGFLKWLSAQKVEKRKVLIYVGSLSERKNIKRLIENVLDQPGLSLVICGRGPQKQFVENSCSRSSEKNLHYAGAVDNPSEYMSKCDMLVLPSLAEGFPLVIIEAASVGLPSLLSNIETHEELAALGLGATFDHLYFQDFRQVIEYISISFDSSDLVRLWEAKFTTKEIFAEYEKYFPNRSL